MCNGGRIETPNHSVMIFNNLKRDEKNYFKNSENHQSLKATQCTLMHSHQEAMLTLPMPVHYVSLVPSLGHCDLCFYAALHT